MSSHFMGVLLDELLIIRSMDLVIMFVSDDVRLSTLIISIGRKSISCRSLCFSYVSTSSFFLKSALNWNNQSDSAMALLSWF